MRNLELVRLAMDDASAHAVRGHGASGFLGDMRLAPAASGHSGAAHFGAEIGDIFGAALSACERLGLGLAGCAVGDEFVEGVDGVTGEGDRAELDESADHGFSFKDRVSMPRQQAPRPLTLSNCGATFTSTLENAMVSGLHALLENRGRLKLV